jgi:hypothetical protein
MCKSRTCSCGRGGKPHSVCSEAFGLQRRYCGRDISCGADSSKQGRGGVFNPAEVGAGRQKEAHGMAGCGQGRVEAG